MHLKSIAPSRFKAGKNFPERRNKGHRSRTSEERLASWIHWRLGTNAGRHNGYRNYCMAGRLPTPNIGAQRHCPQLLLNEPRFPLCNPRPFRSRFFLPNRAAAPVRNLHGVGAFFSSWPSFGLPADVAGAQGIRRRANAPDTRLREWIR